MSTTLIIVASATPAGLLGALVALAPSLRIRRRADIELAAADAAVAKAEELYAEHERTRKLQPFWSFDAPGLPAPADHEGEVLYVEHPSGEIRALHADDPDVAAGLSRLADEVGLVQALSDRPAEDEDAWGDEQPGEAWFDRLAAWWRENVLDRFKSAEQLDAEFRDGADDVEAVRLEMDAYRVASRTPYVGRHWVKDVQHTGTFPAVPAQRTGDADADLR